MRSMLLVPRTDGLNGYKEQRDFLINAGSRVVVKRSSGHIEWLLDRKLICKVSVP